MNQKLLLWCRRRVSHASQVSTLWQCCRLKMKVKDPDAEYLSDGPVKVSLIVSQHKDLRVLGRNTVFRYKSKQVDPQRVGAELGVGAVCTGRILQLGEQVIIRAEVVAVRGGWQIWGEQYHRRPSDILAVQQEVAEEISSKLRIRLTADDKKRLTKGYG